MAQRHKLMHFAKKVASNPNHFETKEQMILKPKACTALNLISIQEKEHLSSLIRAETPFLKGQCQAG